MTLTDHIQNYNKAKAAHEAACAKVSRLEEREGVNTDSPAHATAEQDQDKACDAEMKAREAVSRFQVSTGNELADMVLALIDGQTLSAPLSFQDREGLRASAERVKRAEYNIDSAIYVAGRKGLSVDFIHHAARGLPLNCAAILLGNLDSMPGDFTG